MALIKKENKMKKLFFCLMSFVVGCFLSSNIYSQDISGIYEHRTVDTWNGGEHISQKIIKKEKNQYKVIDRFKNSKSTKGWETIGDFSGKSKLKGNKLIYINQYSGDKFGNNQDTVTLIFDNNTLTENIKGQKPLIYKKIK